MPHEQKRCTPESERFATALERQESSASPEEGNWHRAPLSSATLQRVHRRQSSPTAETGLLLSGLSPDSSDNLPADSTRRRNPACRPAVGAPAQRDSTFRQV